MTAKFVTVTCKVDCENGVGSTYRAYVNSELFAERTWLWTNSRLEECFQILANPGKYKITYQSTSNAVITASEWNVESGPAKINEDGILEIHK